MKLAIYPGSFDPITNGHLSILKRSLNVFDKVIILVADNPKKVGRIPVEDRIKLIKEVTKDFKNVVVDRTCGLTIKYAQKVGATHLIRGLRAVTDFDYEFQLAEANSYIDSNIDVVFFMSRSVTSFINSSTVMELFNNGVDISNLVPKEVVEYLKKAK